MSHRWTNQPEVRSRFVELLPRAPQLSGSLLPSLLVGGGCKKVEGKGGEQLRKEDKGFRLGGSRMHACVNSKVEPQRQLRDACLTLCSLGYYQHCRNTPTNIMPYNRAHK